MKNNRLTLMTSALVVGMLVSACSLTSAIPNQVRSTFQNMQNPAQVALQVTATQSGPVTPAATATLAATPSGSSSTSNNTSNSSSSAAPVTGNTAALSAYESELEAIYQQVNPSVVNISVIEGASASGSSNNPNAQPNPNGQQFGEALGSGFVWDTQGHIVTNNHVISGATSINVTFADGVTVPAKLVGADPYADLAVVQVDTKGLTLAPVKLADSTQVKVGEVSVAIGNPYGLSNTMTVGVVSAVGRSLPASEAAAANNGPSYTIPDIIQTDAPINPGNSGGVLVNDQGYLIGVTAAIESASGANAGIGFAIPSSIVSKVIPGLIQNGKFDHPYLGISGTTLSPDLAQAMNLPVTTRGALVADIATGGPAEKAGLKGSTQTVTINGGQTTVGGDVITAIDGHKITSMDELISYLFGQTVVGQKVTLTVLRDGKETTVDVTLAARPASTDTTGATNNNPSFGFGNGNNGNGSGSNNGGSGSGQVAGVYMGVSTVRMSAAIAQAMNLPQNTQGVLVESVQTGSPAEKAGLKAGTQQTTINGRNINIGGDVITAIDGNPVTSNADLTAALLNAQPGQDVQLTILRSGKEMTVTVTLASR